MVTTAVGLAVATLLSEDLACITAGVLIASGDLPAGTAVTACALGIFAGDCGLWGLGRIGGRIASALPWLARRVPPVQVKQCRRWLDRHAARTIIVSRFTPGARLPLYVTAGLVGMSPLRFAAWALTASAAWTPTVVLASSRAGEAAQQAGVAQTWALCGVVASALLVMRSARLLVSADARAALSLRRERWTRWDFWPAPLFYVPVVLWIALLSIRYRGLAAITTSNPGIPDGGVVSESKFDILQRLPARDTIPSLRLAAAGQPAIEASHALEQMQTRGWLFPIILKPDVGQRGIGVRRIASVAGLQDYFAHARGDVLLQPYHEGPFEAGIFYYRFPGEPEGHIFSITDKQFPRLVGDGRSTVAALIRRHPRYRLQAALFLQRHAHVADVVLANGEQFPLAVAGNHAQGTMFRDGEHLRTPALERRIDAIARQYPGFFIGRFDVRYRDVEAFKAGRDIAIVELNGATAESTNIYDPHASLLDAYRTLCRQWSLVFAIGAANRAHGAVATPSRRLLQLVLAHLTTRVQFPASN
jgi:membrane protein DedA with SNARE-associated domain